MRMPRERVGRARWPKRIKMDEEDRQAIISRKFAARNQGRTQRLNNEFRDALEEKQGLH